MIHMTIPIIPVAQMRARATVLRGQRHATVYKAPKQRAAEQQLIALMAEHRPDTPLTGPLFLAVCAYMPIPDSWPKKKKLLATQGIIEPDKKPDLDNLVKHVKDCMTALSFWRDDDQVTYTVSRKEYSERPRWEIQVGEKQRRTESLIPWVTT